MALENFANTLGAGVEAFETFRPSKLLAEADAIKGFRERDEQRALNRLRRGEETERIAMAQAQRADHQQRVMDFEGSQDFKAAKPLLKRFPNYRTDPRQFADLQAKLSARAAAMQNLARMPLTEEERAGFMAGLDSDNMVMVDNTINQINQTIAEKFKRDTGDRFQGRDIDTRLRGEQQLEQGRLARQTERETAARGRAEDFKLRLEALLEEEDIRPMAAFRRIAAESNLSDREIAAIQRQIASDPRGFFVQAQNRRNTKRQASISRALRNKIKANKDGSLSLDDIFEGVVNDLDGQGVIFEEVQANFDRNIKNDRVFRQANEDMIRRSGGVGKKELSPSAQLRLRNSIRNNAAAIMRFSKEGAFGDLEGLTPAEQTEQIGKRIFEISIADKDSKDAGLRSGLKFFVGNDVTGAGLDFAVQEVQSVLSQQQAEGLRQTTKGIDRLKQIKDAGRNTKLGRKTFLAAEGPDLRFVDTPMTKNIEGTMGQQTLISTPEGDAVAFAVPGVPLEGRLVVPMGVGGRLSVQDTDGNVRPVTDQEIAAVAISPQVFGETLKDTRKQVNSIFNEISSAAARTVQRGKLNKAQRDALIKLGETAKGLRIRRGEGEFADEDEFVRAEVPRIRELFRLISRYNAIIMDSPGAAPVTPLTRVPSFLDSSGAAGDGIDPVF